MLFSFFVCSLWFRNTFSFAKNQTVLAVAHFSFIFSGFQAHRGDIDSVELIFFCKVAITYIQYNGVF